MKKNIVQDVMPPKKSIRNIKIPPKRSSLKDIDKPIKNNYDEKDFIRPVPIQAPIKIENPRENLESTIPTTDYKYEYNDNNNKSKKWVYLFGSILIISLAFGISTFFKSAEIKVTPKQESRSINENFTATKDVLTGLGFQTVSVSKEVEKIVKSTGEERVERKSRGTIVIYNNFSSQSQRLVATTRFQTPEGLIYRLINPVTVPGRETKDGKTVPGSVEVLVEADKPGVSYNIGLKDFTIPGFNGDPRFNSIYARSKTEMTGGFSGLQKTVSKDILDASEEELKNLLETSLQADIKAQIPANFVSYKDGLIYELDETTQMPASGDDEVILKKKGRATAVIFDKGVLTKTIFTKTIPEIEEGQVRISNIEDLEFKPVKNIISSDKEISFSISGQANLIWVFDENKLKEDLLGLSKKSGLLVIENYPSITEASIETKPFWNRKIPLDGEKVTLINTSNTNEQ